MCSIKFDVTWSSSQLYPDKHKNPYFSLPDELKPKSLFQAVAFRINGISNQYLNNNDNLIPYQIGSLAIYGSYSQYMVFYNVQSEADSFGGAGTYLLY